MRTAEEIRAKMNRLAEIKRTMPKLIKKQAFDFESTINALKWVLNTTEDKQ